MDATYDAAMKLRSAALKAVVGTSSHLAGDGNRTRLNPVARQSQRVLKLASSQPPRNVTIGRDPAFVWYRVAKVGTRSIVKALHEHDVDFIADHPYSVRIPSRLTEGFFRFAFVRDPRSRLVSCWRNKVIEADRPTEVESHIGLDLEERKSLRDFGDFVQFVVRQDPANCDIHFRPQTRLVDVDHVDFVGRFESFDRDVHTVFEQLGIPAELPHLNRSTSTVADPYTPSLLAQVEEFYADDLEAFSY